MTYEIRSGTFQELEKDIRLIRYEVFENEQKINKSLLYGEIDREATHYVIYSVPDNVPISSLQSYAVDDNKAKFWRVAIQNKYRKAGLGLNLVKKALQEVGQRSKTTQVIISA